MTYNTDKTDQYACSNTHTKKISPESLLELVHQGKTTYAGLEKIKFLNFALIDYLEGLKQNNKPLIVDVRNIKSSAFFNAEILYHFLLHADSVDFIVDRSIHTNFSLKYSNESFFSNTFFIGEEVNAITKERMYNKKSFFRKSYKRCKIEKLKYLSLPNLQEKILEYQRHGKKVALVSGVFDVMHEGHLSLLENATKSADILIVLINSDFSASSQAKNKHGDRPIHSLEERIAVLNSLEFVSHITAFDNETISPILENLTDMVYVKTEKDLLRDSIIYEMEIVSKNGGLNIVVPFTSTQSGNKLSSSNIIKESRRKTIETITLSEDETWSPSATKKLLELVSLIQKSENIQKFFNIKRLLYRLHSKSRVERSLVERRAIQRIISFAKNLIKEFALSQDYSYILLYILGKLLHFDIRIVALQYNKPGLPYGMVNALRLIDGTTVFFTSEKGLLADPVTFENNYIKLMPHHTHFMAKDLSSAFAARVYIYPAKLHYKALSIQLLLKEYQQRPAKLLSIQKEIETLAHEIWIVIEQSPYQIPHVKSHNDLTISNKRWPSIIAHGGLALLSPKDPYAENSKSGILHALKSEIDAVEIDVNPCKDSWIVSHDQRLEIGSIAKGLLKDLTENEAKKIHLRLSSGKPSSETLMSFTEVLALVAANREDDKREIYVKIDVKYVIPGCEEKLKAIIINSGIPYKKILLTSQLVNFNKKMHKLLPQLPFEFNTVETNLYLLAYGLMDEKIMPSLYMNYIVSYASCLNAKTVSLAQFALDNWGENISTTLISKLHQLGYSIQVWVASTIEEYCKCASLGADYVLMQDPAVIAQAIRLKYSKSLLL
ncbi:adenylyltransferase/cytidyltransferase family protein [Patescibacteria group bacterium]|nr:adenylyltransferase/cytidyltransferase family protein [Patescibacteria group bacterium]